MHPFLVNCNLPLLHQSQILLKLAHMVCMLSSIMRQVRLTGPTGLTTTTRRHFWLNLRCLPTRATTLAIKYKVGSFLQPLLATDSTWIVMTRVSSIWAWTRVTLLTQHKLFTEVPGLIVGISSDKDLLTQTGTTWPKESTTTSTLVTEKVLVVTTSESVLRSTKQPSTMTATLQTIIMPWRKSSISHLETMNHSMRYSVLLLMVSTLAVITSWDSKILIVLNGLTQVRSQSMPQAELWDQTYIVTSGRNIDQVSVWIGHDMIQMVLRQPQALIQLKLFTTSKFWNLSHNNLQQT